MKMRKIDEKKFVQFVRNLAKKTEYERGFTDTVNCRCAICSRRRKVLKDAARKLRTKRQSRPGGRDEATR
jgi:hypothetical protein